MDSTVLENASQYKRDVLYLVQQSERLGDEYMTESGLLIFLGVLLLLVVIVVVIAVVSSVAGAAAAIVDDEDGEEA